MNARNQAGPRPDDRKVEPLLAALEEDAGPRTASPRSKLPWKLFWAALLLLALVLLVVKQAF